MKIKLERVIEAIEMAGDNWTYFYDTQTGENIWLGDQFSDVDYEETTELLDSDPDRFLRLPTKFDVHEYSIMEDFVYSLPAGAVRSKLERDICGRGAFRRFKDSIRSYGITQQWYDFQAEAYRKIAIRWCMDEQIEYEE